MRPQPRPDVLVFLPAGNGLPGIGHREIDRLNREMPSRRWLPVGNREEFLRLLPGAEAALVWGFKREWLDRAPQLRLIATPAAGRDWIEADGQTGPATLFGTFHGILMAETVVGMMLAFVRGIRPAADMLAAGDPWPRERVAATMRPLRGARAVILGFGHIGKWIGRLLKPFGMHLRGVNRTDMTRPDYFDAGDAMHGMADLDGLLPETDHLILALPGGRDSERILDARRLALLPRRAFVYNVGRGNAIDQAALTAALSAGSIAGAGLDVFAAEPLPPDDPVRKAPNLILLPHVSAFAPNYFDLWLDDALPRMRQFLQSTQA